MPNDKAPRKVPIRKTPGNTGRAPDGFKARQALGTASDKINTERGRRGIKTAARKNLKKTISRGKCIKPTERHWKG